MASVIDPFHLKSVPSKFKYICDPPTLTSDSFPVVDFSALSSDDPDQQSKAIDGLSKAFEEWGFITLVNHGIPEELMDATFLGLKGFMSLGVDEKKQFAGKIGEDPLQYVGFGMINVKNDETLNFWREKLWLDVHPNFHCPPNPPSFREAMLEFVKRLGEVATKLMEAVSSGLQLEYHYVDQALGLDSSYQIVSANYYPPCPRPDQAIGIIPHTDPFLFTLLVHNGVSGFQIERQGQWFNVDTPKDSILFNVSDQLEKRILLASSSRDPNQQLDCKFVDGDYVDTVVEEINTIFSNGRYKSLLHRAMVNEERERMSLVLQYGPSKEAIIGPAAALLLLDKDGGHAMYRSIKFADFIHRLFNNGETVSTYKQ